MCVKCFGRSNKCIVIGKIKAVFRFGYLAGESICNRAVPGRDTLGNQRKGGIVISGGQRVLFIRKVNIVVFAAVSVFDGELQTAVFDGELKRGVVGNLAVVILRKRALLDKFQTAEGFYLISRACAG